MPMGKVFVPFSDAIRVLVGGDVNFDAEPRSPGPVGVHRNRDEVDNAVTRLWNKVRLKFARRWPAVFQFHQYTLIQLASNELTIKYPVAKRETEHDRSACDSANRKPDGSSALSRFDRPFHNLKPLFKKMDFVLINLETPLADNQARVVGMFCSDPRYARALADAGISMVNLANNHIFDALETGLLQTAANLDQAGVLYTGYGMNLAEARRGKSVTIKNIKFVFLGYTQYCNAQFASIAAQYPGVLPLDRQLIVEDIRRARKEADFVFVSVHWGIEDQPYVQKKSVELAHLFVDAGADAIIGHHPHVPHGIEVYKGKPILYSLGNLVFGIGDEATSDNIITEIVIEHGSVRGLLIYPVSGRGREVCCPEILNGTRAIEVLNDMRRKSAVFGTGIAIQGDAGYVDIQADR